MAQLTPEQRRTRERVERLSRIVEPEDNEYYPVRSGLLEPEAGATPETPPEASD